MVQALVSLVFVAFGLAHIRFLLDARQASGELVGTGQAVLTADTHPGQRAALTAAWILPIVGFVACGVGVALGQGWWEALATTSAVISVVLLAFRLGDSHTGAILAATFLDALIIGAVVWQQAAESVA